MALRDKPQIDPSAANSSRSERKLNDWFNEDTGFILRKEQPDKGCDYMCEMLDKTGATNWKFPIQLKSIQKPNLVGQGTYISYPILTSRLGYMLNQLPTTGIIVFYAVDSDNLFYEFSHKVYERIKSERESDDWTLQESVNIRVPLANVLTASAVKSLHQLLMDRFANAARMQVAFGDRYQLPVIELVGTAVFDWNNPEHLRSWLREYGQAMLFHFDLAPLHSALQRLTIADIERDKELLVLACVAYGETGRYLESDLFIKKLRYKFSLDESEIEMIDFAEAKNQLKLGQMTPAGFIRKMETRLPRMTSKQNELTLRINLQRFRIAELRGPVETPSSILSELRKIYGDIETSTLHQHVKDILTLWNAEHDSHLMTHQQHLDYISFRMMTASGREIPREERVSKIRDAMDKEMQFLKRIENIYNRATREDHKFLQATAQSLLGIFALQKLFSLLSYPDSPKIPEEEIKRFTRYAFTAFRLFREMGNPVDAYRSLCTTLELMYVTKHYYNEIPEHYIEALQSDKAELENQFMIPSYPLQIPPVLKRITGIETSGVNDSLAPYSDIDLESLARLVFNQLRLPQERFVHFHNEYIATRLFQQRCTDPDVQFFCYNYGSTVNAYIQPVQYVLKNKVSGIESVRSGSMEDLLHSWGF